MQKTFVLVMLIAALCTRCNNAVTNTATSTTDSTASATATVKKEFVSQPLVSHIYTADPSVHVFNGRIYIYPSHDTATDMPENGDGDHFNMMDYHVLSMDSVGGVVTDHGIALDIRNIPWAGRQLWAPDAVFVNDTYYLYFPVKDKQGIFRIGVATSSKPDGHFVAASTPVAGSYSIDPAVFKDDDGSCYLYFGGIWGGQLQKWNNSKYDSSGKLHKGDEPAILPRIARMNKDMKSFAGPVKEIQLIGPDGKTFLEKDNDKRFFEGAWMHKYKGKYYFSYSTGDTHNICYATGDSPYGPFTYRGIILKPVQGWTSHISIADFKDKWYLFYHDTQLSGKTHLRNVKMTELKYNADGTIQTIDPFRR